MSKEKTMTIKLVKSGIGRMKRHKLCIKGLGFKDVPTAKASVSKIEKSDRTHAHKIQAAIAMEQRAKEMGKKAEAAIPV